MGGEEEGIQEQEESTNPRHILSLKEKVAVSIAAISPQVEESVVSVLVGRELKKRSEAAVLGFDKLAQLEQEGRKIRPDSVLYGDDGKIAQSLWSPEAKKKREEHDQKVQKLRKALELALEKADFQKLYELTKSS